MPTEQNAAIARRYYEDVWDQGNLAAVDDLVAPSIVLNGWAPGLEGLKKVISSTRASFPDLHHTLEDVIPAQEKVVVRFKFHGTHQGEYRGIAPTGKPVTYTGIGIWRIADGKLVEHWSNIDLYGLMQQLGAVAKPA
jgi:predicted ester cyclase